MVTRSRQKICAASLPNLTLFLIFGINYHGYPKLNQFKHFYQKKIQSTTEKAN